MAAAPLDGSRIKAKSAVEASLRGACIAAVPSWATAPRPAGGRRAEAKPTLCVSLGQHAFAAGLKRSAVSSGAVPLLPWPLRQWGAMTVLPVC